MLNRTALYSAHQKLGARLVEFGGWEMPVQYTSIVDEHLAVRNAAGIFDISHMGEVLVTGGEALEFLNSTLTNDLRKLNVGQGQYTLLCLEDGGVVDDLYAYRIGGSEFLLVINASRIDADVAWFEERLRMFLREKSGANVTLENASARFGAVAVQGPKARRFIDECFAGTATAGMAISKPSELAKNQIARLVFAGEPVWISCTGYTGEDGFEIIAPDTAIEEVWNHVLSAGQPFGIKPAGLGARDTLRTEMCYPLYGHELDDQTTPVEAGVGFFVSLDKGEFTGRAVLARQKSEGVQKKSVAFRMADKSPPPRPQYPVFSVGGAKPLGVVTSGTQSPCLGIGIGMAYVTPDVAKPGNAIEIEIRGRRYAATTVPKPIYRK